MLPTPLQQIIAKIEPFLLAALILYFFGLEQLLGPQLTGIIQLLSYVIILLLILTSCQIKRFLYILTLDKLLLLLTGLAVASYYWSASPSATLEEVKSAVRSLVIGAYLVTRYSPKQQMQLMSWVFASGTILSILFNRGAPSSDGSIGWAGIFAYKNNTATFMILTFLTFFLMPTTTVKERRIKVAISIISLAMLFLTKGKSSYLVFFAVLSLLPIYKFVRQNFKLRVGLLLTLLLTLGGIAILVSTNLEYIFVDLLGKDLEFNGRMPIWRLIADKISERPLLGYGFSGFWTSDEALYVLNNSWGSGSKGLIRFNSHNGYLDFILQLGFVGFFVLATHIIFVFKRLIQLLVQEQSVEPFWMLQSISVLLLLNLSDSLGILSKYSLWILSVSFALSSALQVSRLRKKKAFAKLVDSYSI